eukprot:jgi/Undpi1/5372/HiC_scaffold_2.g00653.m1
MARAISLLLAATPWLISGVLADHDVIAGYTPASDVVEHSELDLDMEEIDEQAGLETEAGFAAAYLRYDEGFNSEKTDSIRTIRGFSTSAQGKLTGEKWFDIYAEYWDGNQDYADLFTTSACNGTDAFEGASMVTRSEACVKGAQYQNIWMYVIHELEDAIEDCEIGDLDANDGGPHAWDEGWAFYAGSLEGTDGSGDGFMIHALADKRCANFATCTGDDDGSVIAGTSAVNEKMVELFQQGQVHLLNGDCGDAEDVKDEIVDLMTVPLMQGLLRYLYLADPDAGDGGDKEAAELWAFAASVLPRIDECDSDIAVTIRANTDISSSDAPVSEGFVLLKEKLESVYSCMGISCSQIGGLVVADSTEYYEGFEPCGDSSNKLDDAAIAGIVIGVVAVLAICGGVLLCKRRNKKKTAQAMSSDLGGFGNKATGTL